MTTISSPLAVAGTGAPLINAGELHKLQAAVITLPTLTALNDLIVKGPLWYEGTMIRLLEEPFGVFREWRVAQGNALKVWFAPGVSVTLGDNTKKVATTAGFPTGGVDGDVRVDFVNRAVYQRATGTWSMVEGLYGRRRDVTVTASRDLVAADLTARLVCNSSSAIVLNIPSTFGSAGDEIPYERRGAGAVSFTGSVLNPYDFPPQPVDGEGLIVCKTPGTWKVMA